MDSEPSMPTAFTWTVPSVDPHWGKLKDPSKLMNVVLSNGTVKVYEWADHAMGKQEELVKEVKPVPEKVLLYVIRRNSTSMTVGWRGNAGFELCWEKYTVSHEHFHTHTHTHTLTHTTPTTHTHTYTRTL